MPRLRTLTETYAHLKIMDSETAITPNALRRMVVSGQVPCVKIGKKYLIDLDTLENFLKGTRPENVLPNYKPPIKIIQNEYRMRRAR
jgi:hypothetical protein